MAGRRRAKRKTPYDKAPFHYSETYRLWRAAIGRGDASEAARLSRNHRAKFGPPMPERRPEPTVFRNRRPIGRAE